MTLHPQFEILKDISKANNMIRFITQIKPLRLGFYSKVARDLLVLQSNNGLVKNYYLVFSLQ